MEMLYQTKSLQSLIKGLRSAQQNHQEAEFIASSLQEVKNELSANNGSSGAGTSGGRAAAVRSVALQKLVYLQMMGVDISFAAFSIIEGMAATKFSAKRPAYAAAAIAFAAPPASVFDHSLSVANSPLRKSHEQSEQKWPLEELALLTINLFKKDLSSKEMYETGLALHTLCSVRLSAETVGALLPDVLVLLGSSRPYVRKKAALCSTFFLLKQIRAQRTHGLQAGRLGEGLHSAKPGDAVTLSDEDSEVAPLLQRLQQQLMAEQDVAVLSCLTTALLQVAAVEPRPFRSLAPPLFHLLCTSSSNWFTLKLLKLFSLLCDAEPRLPAKLLQPLLQILEKTKAKSVEVEAVRLALFHAPLEEALEEALFLKAKNASHEAAASQAASALTSDLREGSGNPDAASSAEGEPREARLLKFVLQRLQGLLTAADRNLRFVALDVLLQTFQRRRSFAKRLWKLLTGFQMQLLQAAEEQDPSLRRVAVALLAASAEPETFAFVCERLVQAASEAQQNAAHLGGGAASTAAASRPRVQTGEASSPSTGTSWLHRGDFLLPVLRMAREGDFELVLDFEWFVALLADIASSGPPVVASDRDEEAVAAAVAEQMLEISVRVPDVRPCAAHLSLVLLEAAALRGGGGSFKGPSGSGGGGGGLELLRALRRQHKQQAQLREATAGSEGASAAGVGAAVAGTPNLGVEEAATAAPSVHPDVLRAAGWIVGGARRGKRETESEASDCSLRLPLREPRRPWRCCASGEYSAALRVGADSEEAAVSVVERATSCLCLLAKDATLPASCRRVILWAALKLYLALTASARREVSPEKEAQAAKAGMRRLRPTVESLCREAASSLDAELQPPEALDLDKPFVNLAELQRRLDSKGAAVSASCAEGLDGGAGRARVSSGAEGSDARGGAGSKGSSAAATQCRVVGEEAGGRGAFELFSNSGDSAEAAPQVPWGGGAAGTLGRKKFAVIRDAIAPPVPSSDSASGEAAAKDAGDGRGERRRQHEEGASRAKPLWMCAGEDDALRLFGCASVSPNDRGGAGRGDSLSVVQLRFRCVAKAASLAARALVEARLSVALPQELSAAAAPRLEVGCSREELLEGNTRVQVSADALAIKTAADLKPLFFSVEFAYRLSPAATNLAEELPASADGNEEEPLRRFEAKVCVPLRVLLKPLLFSEDELGELMQVRLRLKCASCASRKAALFHLWYWAPLSSQHQGSALGFKETFQISLSAEASLSAAHSLDADKTARRCFAELASETSFHLVKVQTQGGVSPGEARVLKALFVAQTAGAQSREGGGSVAGEALDARSVVVGFLACSARDAERGGAAEFAFSGSVRSASSSASALVCASWNQWLKETGVRCCQLV